MSETQTIGTMLPFAAWHGFADGNTSRVQTFKVSGSNDYGDADRARLVLELSRGHNPSVSMITVYPLTKAEQKSALAEREQEWQTLQNLNRDFKVGRSTLSPAQIREAWASAYMDENNSIITPKFGVVTGFRRTAVIPHLLAYTNSTDTLETETQWPVIVREFGSVLDRMVVNHAENESKTAGAKTLSVNDQLAWSLAMYGEQATEADFVRAGLKRGKAQQLHRLCQLNQRMARLLPDAEPIIDRIMNPEDPAELGHFDKEGTKKALLDLDDSDFTLEAINGHIANGGVKPAKIASKKEISGVAQSPVVLVAFVAEAMLAADTGRLNRFVPVADALNAAITPVLENAGIDYQIS